MFGTQPGEARMPVTLRTDQFCEVIGCLAPARELGGLCTRCWLALAPSERDILKWEAEQPTEEWDAELLRMLATMADSDSDSHFKDAA